MHPHIDFDWYCFCQIYQHLLLYDYILWTEKFYEFACSMLKTLERYQKCNYGAPETNVSTREALVNFTFFPLFNLFFGLWYIHIYIHKYTNVMGRYRYAFIHQKWISVHKCHIFDIILFGISCFYRVEGSIRVEFTNFTSITKKMEVQLSFSFHHSLILKSY